MHLTTEATPTTSPSRPPTTPSSRTATPAAMWLFCLLASTTIACFEYRYYRRALDFPPLPLPATATLFWALTAKTLALLSPGLLLATTLSLLRHPRVSWTLFSTSSLSISLFLLADLQSQRQAGAHLLDLLRYALFPNAGQVAGGTAPILTQSLLVLLPTTLATLTTLHLCSYLTRHLPSPLPKRWHLPTLTLTYTALTLGVLPAQLWFPTPHTKILQRLYASLPIPAAHYLAAGSLVGDTESFSVPLNRYLLPTLRQLGDPIAPRPLDTRLRVLAPNPPNVVIICCDSLRADALTPDRMPRLYAYAQKGLWLRHHYAQTNASQFGIFTLLYGRSAAAYDATLDAHIPPQLTTTLALAGYRRTYLSPMQYLGWARMDEYISPQSFDDRQITTTSFDVADRILLNRTKLLLRYPPDGHPQFVLAFLSSTHHPYVYPKDYAFHTPAVPLNDMSLGRGDFTDHTLTLNRYLNAARYADDAVADFLDSIDLTRTIVILTGDHGESLWQDGSLAHGTRPSEVQTRVPCFLLAPNLPPQAVDQWTGHTDLLPTLLHAINGRDVGLRHTDGRDLLKPTKSPVPDLIPQSCVYNDSRHVTIDLFAPDGRIRVRVDRRRPNVTFVGTIDARGNVDAFQAPPAHTARTWAHRLERALRAMRN